MRRWHSTVTATGLTWAATPEIGRASWRGTVGGAQTCALPISGAPVILRADRSEPSRRFASRPDAPEVATRGPLTPDHVIHTKPVPLVAAGGWDEAVAQYGDRYRAYVGRYAGDRESVVEGNGGWSSDVCSSDLGRAGHPAGRPLRAEPALCVPAGCTRGRHARPAYPGSRDSHQAGSAGRRGRLG